MEVDNNDVVETYLPDVASIAEFHSLPNKDKLVVIKLGLALYNEGISKMSQWKDQDAATIVENLKHAHNVAISELEDRIKAAERRFDLTDKERSIQHASNVKSAVESERAVATSQRQQLEQTNQRLIAQLQTIQGELYEKQTSLLQEREASYQERIDGLRRQMDEMRTGYEARLNRATNSTLKGADGEEYVLGKLNMMFPTADIEDTHAMPHRGDFILRDSGMTLMIETKNYSRNVQKAEIDKFYRDIDNPSNSDVQAALFVSLSTGICNRADFEFEIRNKVPIVFIHNLCDNFESVLLAVKLFRLILEQDSIDLSTKEIKDSFKNAASTLKRNFNRQKSILDKYHTEQMQLITGQQANVADLFSLVKQKF